MVKLKFTKSQLKKIIKEELQYVLQEATGQVVWADRNRWKRGGEPRDDVYEPQDATTLQSSLGGDYYVVAPPNQGGSAEEWGKYIGDGRTAPMPHPSGATLVVPLNTFNTHDGRVIWFKEATLDNPRYGSVVVPQQGPTPEEEAEEELRAAAGRPWEHN